MIFNKSDNGAQEFKSLIGFIYASLNFNSLKSFVKLAAAEVKKVIGPEIYTLAEDHYLSDDFGSNQDSFLALNELVERVQLPIALLAYRKFAPGNDLSHSDSGRRMTVNDTEKQAFEWMIDKDDANLVKLYNDAFELLLSFLDEQLIVPEGEEINDIGEAWNNSDAFKSVKSVIVNSVAAFESVIPINSSRRLYLLLLPYIRKAERDLISPMITRTRYDAMIEALRDGDMSDDQLNIQRLATPPVAMKAMAQALKLIPVESLPDAFALRFAADKRSDIATDDRLAAAQILEHEAGLEMLKLQRYISSITPVTEEETDLEDPAKRPFWRA